MIEQTICEVTVDDLYEDDLIWVASVDMYALVGFCEELGPYATLLVDSESAKLQRALEETGLSMRMRLIAGQTYEKVIEEDI